MNCARYHPITGTGDGAGGTSASPGTPTMHKAPALVQNAKVSLKHPMAGGVDADGRLGEDQHHLADGSWPPVPPSARALEASPGRWLRDVLIGQDSSDATPRCR